MSDRSPHSVVIPIAAARRGELRVGLPCEEGAQVGLEIFGDPWAAHAQASLSLTPDGARALIHALQTALEEPDHRREGRSPALRARDMRPARARAA
jgi:hypothetical protein